MVTRISQFLSDNIAALTSFLVAAVGGLMPIWIVACILWLTGSWQGFAFFWVDGEFYLYAAAFSTQAGYLLVSYLIRFEDRGNKKVLLMLAAAAVVLILSTVFYSATITSSLSNNAPQPLGLPLAISSLVLLFVSLFFVFGAEYYHAKQLDLPGIYKKQEEKIEEEI